MNSEVLFANTVKRLQASRHVVIFTGAGISAESGIATFRDHLTGLWSRYDQQQLATPAAFVRDPGLVWGWYSWRRKLVGKAQPNDAHLAVVKLTQCLPRVTVITQNVDDLHERAGCKEVIHLHGNLASARCFECNRPYLGGLPVSAEPDGARQEPPYCSHCDGRIRPDVVWFGETLPEEGMMRAFAAACDCDVLLSIGTSGSVYPAARIPKLATEQGAWAVHINIEPTEASSDKVLVGPASLWLPRLAEALA
ncbi:SIR2 family NAD-dependent protein deacylase [Pseudomonas chlororaphis]|uniref:SIR2 family NAD-dependent protein deacylase n=1 Tax=Pseudomonas chlororaphis TaxID=587753 RepID=UPI000BE3C1CC|nr:NAD-dependent deacylase [Pseudomonas chlororaphis]